MKYRANICLRGPGRFPTWLRRWEERETGAFDVVQALLLDTAFRQWYLMTERGE